jgi:hypothetical protein
MTTRHAFAVALIAAVAVAAPSLVLARDDIRKEPIQFAAGKSGTTVTGSIKGYETVDYILRAATGQTMSVSLKTNNLANYFNVLPPGSSDVAIFTGSTSGNEFSGTLSDTGDYTVRVYLMRSAARRDETANYTLDVNITGAANSGASEGDAKVPGTDYHATGNIPCSMGGGQPMGQCPFGVKREGNGAGMVTVTKPDGRTRVIFFDNGRATGYDMSQADPGEFSADKQSDLNIIRIGGERYEIPDAVIFGG